MAAKFLDLDAIHKPLGQFRLGGQTYDVYPLSLKGLINLSQLPSQLETDDPQQGVPQLAQAVEVLAELVPDCPREAFDRLSLPQINALMEWANSLGEEQVTKNSRPPRTRGR